MKLFHIGLRRKSRLRMKPTTVMPSLPAFCKRDAFTFDLQALNVPDMGMRFRLLQWGTTETGLCKSVNMCYLLPSHEDPVKAIQIMQADLEATNVMPAPGLSDEGRQDQLLRSHQELYAGQHREHWFLHVDKRTCRLETLTMAPLALDAWQGPRRAYWIWRTFVGQVAFEALFSGFSQEEASTTMTRLVRIAADANLAQWHDEEHQAYLKRIS